MPYKTILAYLSSQERAAALLKMALPLAEQHHAHLIGLHVVPIMSIYGEGVIPAELSPELLERSRIGLRDEAEAVKQIFSKMTADAGAKAEWRIEDALGASSYSSVIRHAMCTDLVIASQTQNLEWGSGGDLVADLVMGAGRPVLLVPNAGEFGRVGERVMIAWNASREAARAAFDAIPLIQGARDVRVLAIDTDDHDGRGGLSPADDLVLALARHGVKAEAASSLSGTISVADDLPARLADGAFDLLVMGCYGHARMREMLFGGVTRHILQHMTIPVLMSH